MACQWGLGIKNTKEVFQYTKDLTRLDVFSHLNKGNDFSCWLLFFLPFFFFINVGPCKTIEDYVLVGDVCPSNGLMHGILCYFFPRTQKTSTHIGRKLID